MDVTADIPGRRHVMIRSHGVATCGWWHIFANDGAPVVEWHDGSVQKLPDYYSIQFTDECWQKAK